jgi:uncharacterized protein
VSTPLRSNALVRIVVEAVAVVATFVLASAALGWLLPPRSSPLHDGCAFGGDLFVAAVLVGVYVAVVRWLERRLPVELEVRKGGRQLLGMVLIAVVFAIFWVAGLASFGAGTGVEGLGVGWSSMFMAAVFEELLFRAVLFRIVEQVCGTSIALIASALVFGILHGANPSATLFSDVAIALEAGILLAVAFVLTRNLWLAIGIHTGWNFAEGSLFGAHISGTVPTYSVVHASLTGSELLTGGAFGPEASIVSVGVGGLAALIIGIMAVRRGRWFPAVFRLTLP